MTQAVDIGSLIYEISSKNPTGICLRSQEDTLDLYFEIKDLRNRARTIERKNTLSETKEDPTTLWEQLSILGQQLLVEKTKDLEIACWLTESWLRLQGFDGLNLGLVLIHDLLEKYSADIYPGADEDGVETTLACLIGLNGCGTEGSLMTPIRCQYITQGISHGPFTLWQYQQAITQEQSKNTEKPHSITLEMIKLAMKETAPSFYQNLDVAVENTIESFSKLQDLLSRLYHDKAPPSANIKNSINDFKEHLRFIFHEINFSLKTLKERTSEDEPLDIKSNSYLNVNLITNEIKDRQSALSHLNKIAQFFKETEPHSPLSYSIERIIRWGNMSLPELMRELIDDEKAKSDFLSLTGLPK